jgi:hypothetical protein
VDIGVDIASDQAHTGYMNTNDTTKMIDGVMDIAFDQAMQLVADGMPIEQARYKVAAIYRDYPMIAAAIMMHGGK